jgi:argininosuccinate synthase
MRDLEAFLESSQTNVSGDVFATLKPYHFTLDGISSKKDLMNSVVGCYGEENKAWTADEAKGFIKIYANQSKIFQNIHK